MAKGKKGNKKSKSKTCVIPNRTGNSRNWHDYMNQADNEARAKKEGDAYRQRTGK